MEIIKTNTIIILENSDEDTNLFDEIKNLTKGCKKLISLKSFKRFMAIYELVDDAAEAKQRLHGHYINQSCKNIRIRAYYGAHTDLNWLHEDQNIRISSYLQVPTTSKNFLLSPPGSPAIGWVQTSESAPSKGGFVFPQDLADARVASQISLLDFTLDGGVQINDSCSPRESVHIVQFPHDVPEIRVHGDGEDEEVPGLLLKMGFQQTSRPPLSL